MFQRRRKEKGGRRWLTDLVVSTLGYALEDPVYRMIVRMGSQYESQREGAAPIRDGPLAMYGVLAARPKLSAGGSYLATQAFNWAAIWVRKSGKWAPLFRETVYFPPTIPIE